jgi:hypothetical protein
MAKTTKIDTVTLTGHSGTQYAFRIYVWDTKFKALAGVYVVASRTIEPGAKARYEPVFVSAAPDISTVLTGHPRTDCFQLYYGNVIGVLKQDDAAARDAIAADLVAGLKPPCNAADAE